MKVTHSLVALIPIALAASVARADLTWSAEAIPGEVTARDPHPAPAIRVQVEGETMPGPDVISRFVLRHVASDVRDRPGVSPTRAVPFHRSTETLGIVVLIEGHEYFFGNDSYKQAQACGVGSAPGCRISKVTPGVYATIRDALNAPPGRDEPIPTTIAQAGPPGSRGALVVYGTSAEVRFDGDLAAFSGDKLGDARAQDGQTSREFAAGLRRAQQVLARMPTRHKALLVFSDGFDGGGSVAIDPIKRQLAADGVDIFGFYLDASTEFIDDDAATQRASRITLERLTDDRVTRARNDVELRAAITAAVQALNSSYTLVFPGHHVDPRTRVAHGFQWDGREHPLELMRGDEEIVNYDSQGGVREVRVLLAPRWGGARGGRWWLWPAIAVAGLVVVGLALATRRGRPAVAPVLAVPAPVAAPLPIVSAPNNPAKTMMVNLSSGDGLPVVGWFVPIVGDRQFQTFKLQYGETRIGTTSNAHIVLNDGFMSTDHARVEMSPTGFTLIDNQSTNGTFANERRIARHELIDNDLIMFGKTVCKFKTILGT